MYEFRANFGSSIPVDENERSTGLRVLEASANGLHPSGRGNHRYAEEAVPASGDAAFSNRRHLLLGEGQHLSARGDTYQGEVGMA